MTDVKIVKNFLDKDFFQDLQNLITQSEFPWFQRKTMVEGTTDNLGYFTHSFSAQADGVVIIRSLVYLN